MATLTETTHAGGFILSEANGTLSRERVTLEDGQSVNAGEVLGLITASTTYAVHNPAGADGTENAIAIAFDAAAASGADVDMVVLARDCEVNDNELIWPAGISAGDKADAIASLATVGIIVRS